MTRPRSGVIRPTSDLRNTVLPVPEGPSMTLTSPGGRDSETSRQTTWRPKDFVSPSTTTSMPISPPWVTGGDNYSPPSQPATCAAASPALVYRSSGLRSHGDRVRPVGEAAPVAEDDSDSLRCGGGAAGRRRPGIRASRRAVRGQVCGPGRRPARAPRRSPGPPSCAGDASQRALAAATVAGDRGKPELRGG